MDKLFAWYGAGLSGMEFNPKLKCPGCQSELSYWKLKKKFACDKCKAELEVENYASIMVLVFVLWGLVVYPVIWIASGASIYALIIDLSGLLLMMLYLGPKLVQLGVSNK